MELTGRIKLIGITQTVSESFAKRELVITTEEQYPQHIMIEFTQDKCALLDSYQVGEPVKVGVNLRGREWQSPQGEIRYFNTIQGWRIERSFNQQQQGFNQQQNYGQQQAQNYTSQNGAFNGQGSAVNAYQQQQGFNKQQAPQQQQQQQQGFNQNSGMSQGQNFSAFDNNHDDLPF